MFSCQNSPANIGLLPTSGNPVLNQPGVAGDFCSSPYLDVCHPFHKCNVCVLVTSGVSESSPRSLKG